MSAAPTRAPVGVARRFRAACALAAAALALALGAGPVWPAEDAGTQSVFASSAGNRALAMGGAFVAAVDDASAMVWNPAGLGIVTRAEVEAVQSGDMGLGMSESYAALAWPNWRWGAVGMSLRHFGTGGIEERDTRNQLLADNLTDSELELALGYGRSVGEAWQLGGSVKLQRQSLAGFSGTGVGADLGVAVSPAAALGHGASWARGLRWGLALRNLVPPSIRLDHESVPDPTELRTGIGWRTPMPHDGNLITELDLSRTAGVTPQLEAGLEYRVFPAAAIRFGVHHGTLTAGTGFQWRDLSLDYAFEDNALAPTHRAGVSFRFGATTGESRLAEERREDQRIEQRLAEGFRQRQADQVAGLVKTAADARARGDLDDALESLALAASLDPGNPDAHALETACLADKARELERRGDYGAAVLAWNRVLEVSPGDSAGVAGATRCR
ncbi:MAG TPA: PorV/PorQ family protein, partial [Dongiaceae bacterium]|nr:PorV/PorQ family protein [Dongiaceae bacterium]